MQVEAAGVVPRLRISGQQTVYYVNPGNWLGILNIAGSYSGNSTMMALNGGVE